MCTVPRRSSIALLAAVAAAVAALAGPAAASADEGQIIVKYAAGADAQERSEARADADVVRDQALALPRTELVTPEAGTSVPDAVADLERSADVDYAEPDLPRHALDLYPDEAQVDEAGALVADTPFGNLWAFANEGQTIGGYAGHVDADIDAAAAWDVTTGRSDVKVAVVDSGVDRTHPDLFANLVPGYDFAYRDSDPTDYDGHGTHVAGIIAARGNNGVGVTGVAWQTSIMPVQALDATGSGTTTGIVQAYDYAARRGARIVNASLGGDTFSQTEYDAIKRDKDVLFVVAAGNDHRSDDDPATASYPCAYDLPNIVCVAATNNWDELAYFSNYGAGNVDLAAPGEDIYSTMRCGQYGFLSGTSMATPEVSGAAGLILAQDSSLTPAQVRARLMESADVLPDLAGRVGSGGRLNVATALGVPPVTETTPPPVSNTGAGDGGGDATPPARTVTVAEPRANEPQPPAQTCPTAPARSTAGGTSTPVPPTPAAPSTTAPSSPTPAPAPARPAPAANASRTTSPAADRIAPAIRASFSGRGALRALLAGRLRVSTTVSERASVRVELRLDARTAKKLRLTKRAAAVRIASATATARKAGKKTVTLRLTAKAKRALARARRVKATLAVTAADASGNRRTRSSTLTITR